MTVRVKGPRLRCPSAAGFRCIFLKGSVRDPTLRAGFDELVREWLRLAEQAEWIANLKQAPPLPKRISRRNR